MSGSIPSQLDYTALRHPQTLKPPAKRSGHLKEMYIGAGRFSKSASVLDKAEEKPRDFAKGLARSVNCLSHLSQFS